MQVPFHAERVPGAESALIEDAKLLDYVLNTEHLIGRGKALFFQAIGYTRDDYEELRAVILEALPLVPARHVKENADNADNWEAIITVRRRDKDEVAEICTIWEVREDHPTRLITVYPA